MKLTAVFITVLITVLIIVSSIYVTGKVNLSSQQNTGDTKSSANAGSKDSSSNGNIETSPRQSPRSTEDLPAEHSSPNSGVASNTTFSSQDRLKSAENDTAAGTMSPPDGRIYTGGEAPYAYIPTCSHKPRPLPIMPLTPVD
jgi:hypothetical protein